MLDIRVLFKTVNRKDCGTSSDNLPDPKPMKKEKSNQADISTSWEAEQRKHLKEATKALREMENKIKNKDRLLD